MTKLVKPIKFHGGKHYLAAKIIALMPPHSVYVEPFAGGLSVMLRKDAEGIAEYANDINGELANFWQVLRDPVFFWAFRRLAEATPFAESDFEEAKSDVPIRGYPDRVVRGWRCFVRYRLSISGRGKDYSPGSFNVRRGMARDPSAWLSCVDGLTEVHDRLKRVFIYNRDALDVIDLKDGAETLFYLDPPYLHDTRTSCGEYDFEMSQEQHLKLLDRIKRCEAKVMISGYPSPMYSDALSGWNLHEFPTANHASKSDKKKTMTECVWCNF